VKAARGAGRLLGHLPHSASRCPGRVGTPRGRSARCRLGGPVPTRPE
jgi:hypothetical protein